MAIEHNSGRTPPHVWRDPWVWAVFLLALTVRLLYLADLRYTPFFTAPQMDALYHDQWARRIAGGDWVGTGVYFRAPLYPYFLAGLYVLWGGHAVAVHAAQFLVGAATALATAALAGARFGRRAGVLAGLLVALHGPLIFFEGELLLTVLEAPLDLWTAWALDRALTRNTTRGWIQAGAVLGLAALARPTVLAVLPVTAIYLGFRAGRRAWRPVAVLTLAALAVLSPVLLRNAWVGGDVVPVASQGGLNYYLGNHRGADGMAAIAPEFRRTWTGGIEDANRLAELAEGRSLRPSEVSGYWFRRAMAWARESPGDFLRLQLRKAAVFWDAFEIPNNEDYYYFSGLTRIFRTSALLHFGMLGPLALAGLTVGLVRRRLPFAWVAVPWVLVGVIVAFFVCGRFRASLIPLFAVWSGVGLAEAIGLLRARQFRPLVIYLSVLAVAALAINSDPWDLQKRYTTSESHLRLGIHYAAAGDEGRALEHYRAAVEETPGFADGWNNLGVLHAEAGRRDEAREAFERALALDSGHTKALGNLSALAFAQGRSAEADSLARRVLIAPDWEPAALYNAAVVLGNLGHPAQALRGFRRILDRDPGDAAARVGEARALLLLGRRNEAIRSLRGHPPGRGSPELDRLIQEFEP